MLTLILYLLLTYPLWPQVRYQVKSSCYSLAGQGSIEALFPFYSLLALVRSVNHLQLFPLFSMLWPTLKDMHSVGAIILDRSTATNHSPYLISR